MGSLPERKQEADFLFVRASFDLPALLRWRESLRFDGKVYAGVLVVASAVMAKTLAEATSLIDMPGSLRDALDHHSEAGVDRACALMT